MIDSKVTKHYVGVSHSKFHFREFESSEKKNIFSRLGDETDSKNDPKSPSILRKRISDPITDDLKSQVLKRPSEKTHDKRVSFEGNKQSSDPRTNKKKYVMIQTLANGEKIKKILGTI